MMTVEQLAKLMRDFAALESSLATLPTADELEEAEGLLIDLSDAIHTMSPKDIEIARVFNMEVGV